jgi:two-component system, OmpR family, phosphate regulon sensor histidine kinase PhoR
MRRAGHDLKNNCAAVIAHCELALMELARGDLSALERRLNTVKEIERHSCAIINDKLFDSTISPGIFDFNAVIKTTVGMLSSSLNGIDPVLHLHHRELPVKGDSAAAIRMLHNLLMNARNAIEKAKRTPQGKITLSSQQLTADFCRVEVTDNGCGMEQDEAHKNWANTLDDGQHGIGLQCVRESLEGLRGYLQIRSALGIGTTVSLMLPLCPLALPVAAVVVIQD